MHFSHCLSFTFCAFQGSSYQCPSVFPSGGVLMSYSAALCTRQPNEACFVTCDDGSTRDVYCTEAGVWDNQDPCSSK